jgi:hypothetical protein
MDQPSQIGAFRSALEKKGKELSMVKLTRREALRIVGGAAAAAALPLAASAQAPAFPKGAVIRTLFKDYAPEELAGGATLFHEHLSLGADFGERFRAAAAAVLAAQGAPPSARPAGPPPAPPGPDPMRDVGLMAEELRSARRDGVACIVDAGLEGSGMDLEFIRAAATQSGLPVVKAAGFYTEPFYPKEVATMSEEQLVRALVRQADDYPAGAFGEIGSWDEISALERKVFRAVGKAHGATNLAVFTHTGIPGKSALEQLDILEDSVSTRSASASATSGISTTRRSTCTRRSAGAARSSASTGRAAAATRPSCRSCSRCSTRGSPTTC